MRGGLTPVSGAGPCILIEGVCTDAPGLHAGGGHLLLHSVAPCLAAQMALRCGALLRGGLCGAV